MKNKVILQNLPQIYSARIHKLRALLQKRKLKYFLTENQANVRYLSGFSGSAGWCLISEAQAYLFVDSRYTQLAKKLSTQLSVIEITQPFSVFWQEFSPILGGGKVGFESHNLTHQKILVLRRCARALTMYPTNSLIESLRALKDASEIEQIRKSVEVADQAFTKLLHLLKPGQTEIEIAWMLEKLMRELGAEKIAWHPLIVAAGANSSMPHYAPGEVKIKPKDMLLLDFGAVMNGYHSDITRMAFLGKPTQEQRRVYSTVLEAQERALEQIFPGAKSRNIDRAAREIIETQKYPAYQHGLSHGIGLEVHELPRVSQKSKDILEEGNVISVEPGIYMPGWGGVRIEDLVLVTEKGAEALTKSPKKISKVTV